MKFEDAIKYVLAFEGSDYTNDPKDKGGETKFGISKRAHPNVDIKNLTKDQVIQIYRTEYWDKYGIERFKDEFQLPMFDMTVNMGFKNAVICLQRAINTLPLKIDEDGVLGAQTFDALNEIYDHWGYLFGVCSALKSERASYYRVLAAKDPSQQKFLNGWLRRAYL